MVFEHHTHQPGRYEISLYGLDLIRRSAHIDDATPTGMQIAEVAGFSPTPQITVLQWLDRGLEDIRPTETVNLQNGSNRFIVAESEGSWRMILDGVRYDWPAPRIPISVIRRLGAVSDDKAIFLVDSDRGEVLLADDAMLDLAHPGVENLVTRLPSWKLNVQGVMLTVHKPSIPVREALELAGINADQGWHIFLIVQDQPKHEVGLNDVIDLTTPGIEKLRLTPKDVEDGEAVSGATRQFRLLPEDESYLDKISPDWMAIIDNGRQWVILPNFKVPTGYSLAATDLALDIPPTYPMTQIDMFYLYPEIALSSGQPIPATDYRENIQGKPHQRWSRHRKQQPSSMWRPGIDNIITHLALVEAALLKETER